MQPASDLRISACRALPSPAELRAALPRRRAHAALVTCSRRIIRDILSGADPRLLAVVGPCSIHDVGAGREYGSRLAELARDLGDRFVIVMRAYFEKPRTCGGWPGLLLDPHLDDSGDAAHGLRQTRRFLRDMLDLGLPTATEFLDTISPQYLCDLVCWAAIGARTSESPVHRQLASGLPMPLGFKNGTDGAVQGAVNAVKAAGQAQSFLGIGADGRAAAVRSRGNPDCHVVLRGGAGGPNFSSLHLSITESELLRMGLRSAILVDCSHGNSLRRPELQPRVLAEVIRQVLGGRRSIVGFMVESNLAAGSQSVSRPGGRLRYGVSITDGCLDWESTERCLREAHAALAPRFDSSKEWSPAAELGGEAVRLAAAGA